KFPMQPKKHSLEFLRENAHLRVRTNAFGAIMRVRSVLSFAVHQYYDPGVSGAFKISIAQLKKLFERPGISVYTAE
ncbi:MAG: hypothetical protein EOP06_28605, partial [Proteobacteria bacterium]